MSWTDIQSSTSSLAGIFASQGLAISLTFGGEEIPGIRTTIRRADVNSDMGLLAGKYTFSVLCQKSAFAEVGMPLPRTSKVWIEGKPYRVLSTQTDAIGATVRLDLGDVLQ